MADEQRTITGGTAKLTGALEGGRQGKRIAGARLREIKNGDNAPHDCSLEFDLTPVDQTGDDFGPMPKGELAKKAEDRRNPEMDGVPSWDGSDSHQVARLTYDYEGAGDADLTNEYANHGCTPRVRVRTGGGGGGVLGNLRFVCANGVEIPVRPNRINVGRH